MNRMHYWANPKELKRSKKDYIIKTVEEYNDLFKAIKEGGNRWQDRFFNLCRHYYISEPAGGCMHIVLDDGNLEDGNILWCAGLAHGRQDHEANDLANLMLAMTMKQREFVYHNL